MCQARRNCKAMLVSFARIDQTWTVIDRERLQEGTTLSPGDELTEVGETHSVRSRMSK